MTYVVSGFSRIALRLSRELDRGVGAYPAKAGRHVRLGV